MTPWRDEYTTTEWLQIGAFLVGMPLAAMFGALVGLLGKWKQGRVVFAALTGLGCGALASAMLSLTYWADHLARAPYQRERLLEQFDAFLSQTTTWCGVGMAAGGSLVIALFLRFRAPDPRKQSISFSLGQLLLLQVIAVLALGAWLTLRSTALGGVMEFQQAARKWATRDWNVLTEGKGKLIGLSRDFSKGNQDLSQENASLRRVVAEPWLTKLQLYELGDVENLDLQLLCAANRLNSIEIGFSSTAAKTDRTLAVLAEVKSLETLYLQQGYFTAENLAPLAKLPNLKSLVIFRSTITTEALKELAKNGLLTRVQLISNKLECANQTVLSTNGIDLEAISSVTSEPRDPNRAPEPMRRSHVSIGSLQINAAEIASLVEIPNLATLSIGKVIDSRDLLALRSLTQLRTLHLRGPAKAEQNAAFREALLDVAKMPSLRTVHCPPAVLYDGPPPTLAIAPGGRKRTDPAKPLGEPAASQLRAIEEDGARRTAEFQSKVNFIREELRLESLQINFDQYLYYPFVDERASE